MFMILETKSFYSLRYRITPHCVLWQSAKHLASRIKGLLDDRDSFEDELYEMKRADFAVFDDIGAE